MNMLLFLKSKAVFTVDSDFCILAFHQTNQVSRPENFISTNLKNKIKVKYSFVSKNVLFVSMP